MTRLAALLVLALAASGCSIAVEDLSSQKPTQNACESSADCGGGVCVVGQCQASSGDLSTVLFEITPPATSGAGFAGVHFLKRVTDLSDHGGTFDLAVDVVAQVSGTVTGDGLTGCKFKTTFTPSERLLGLSAASYTASSDASGTFTLGIPAGKYDIYVQPLAATPDTPCESASGAVPPELLREQTIEAGNVALPLTMPRAQTLHVEVTLPGQAPLAGWNVDLVDPVTGHVLSTTTHPDASSSFDLAYNTVIGGAAGDVGHELVRLAPPDALAAPTFLMDRSALELFKQGVATVDQLTSVWKVVHLDGRVEVDETSTPVAADVTFIATSLDNLPPGTLAGYARSVQADAQGRFSVDLLAGSYRVRAVPASAQNAALNGDAPSLAASEDTWTVGATPSKQSGRVILVQQSARITGSVLGPAGNALVGATVQAIASPAKLHVGVLDAALGAAPFVPRATGNTIGDNGVFTLDADPGTYDVSVQPADGTGFAWLVRPNIGVTTGIMDMGQLAIPLPVAYSGHVTVAGHADPASQQDVVIPGALVRAYVYMDKSQAYAADPANAASVLQIAETRADSDGAFQLLLPSHLN